MASRNVRERPAAIFSVAKSDGSLTLPSVNLATVSKQRRPRKGSLNPLSSTLTLCIGSLLTVGYICFNFLSPSNLVHTAKEDEGIRQEDNSKAYNPDWSKRLEFMRPILMKSVPKKFASLKEAAVEECADAESVCEDVKESSGKISDKGNKTAAVPEENKDQIRFRVACGAIMYGCEQAFHKLKEAFNETVSIRPEKFVSTCSEKCLQHGSCNEELHRCDCIGGFAGKDCKKRVLSSCQVNADFRTPCFDESTSCSCILECEKLGLMIHSSHKLHYSCFNDQDKSSLNSSSDKVQWLFSRAVVSLQTDGKGSEVKPRELLEREPLPNMAMDPRNCPAACSWKGACFNSTCTCPLSVGGMACQVPSTRLEGVIHGCLNRCSGRGKCVDGVCLCHRGAFGVDCSILALGHGRFGLLRRNWFPSAFLSFADLKAKVEARHRSEGKRRPRVYVYELPSHLLAGLFQHRRTPKDSDAQARFLEPLLFLEALLASDYRTVDPQEADFFFVPVFPHLHSTADAFPGQGAAAASGAGPGAEQLRQAVEYISEQWPYWTRHQGADHMFFLSSAWGACGLQPLGWRPASLSNAVVLSPWTYRQNMFGGRRHACFVARQDIGVPMAYSSSAVQAALAMPAVSAEDRRFLLVYAAQEAVDRSYKPRTGWFGLEDQYREPGLRKYRTGFGVPRLLETVLGAETDARVHVVPAGPRQAVLPLLQAMRDSVFCLCPPGWGVDSEYSTLAVLAGCIPVFFKTNESYAYAGGLLDWEDISVSVEELEAGEVKGILQSVPQDMLRQKQAALQRVRYRFVWSSPQFNPLERMEHAAVAHHAASVVRMGPFESVMAILRLRLGTVLGGNGDDFVDGDVLDAVTGEEGHV